MIQANEVRIGNYLTFKGSSRVNVKLDRFDLSAILYNEDEVLHYEPIHLTEEILLKCGFEMNEFKSEITKTHLLEFVLHKCDIDIIYFNKNIPEHGFYFGCWESSKTPKYLHQLQNLYFALTGEELNINL